MRKITSIIILSVAASIFLPIAPAVAATTSTSTYSIFEFRKDLKLGSKGDDVKLLQTFLNSSGYRIADKGDGARGRETDYFGKLTQLALIKFQNSNTQAILLPVGLNRGTGNFFSSTRAFVNAMLRLASSHSANSIHATSTISLGSNGGGSLIFANPAPVTNATTSSITSVSINQVAPIMNTNDTLQFSSLVLGTGNFSANVLWSALLGSFNASGLYTAPSVAGSDTVTARSTDDASKFATTSVVVTTPSSLGTTYYVTNSGNDACNGKAQTLSSAGACAWKTVARVNAAQFSPGDTILFKRGDVWSEELRVTSVGASGSPLTFGAYGTGVQPEFTGLSTLGNSWVNLGGNVWRYDISAYGSTTVRYLLLNGVNQKMTKLATAYATSGTTTAFTDTSIGGADGDYVGSEVLMRSSAFTWDTRTVTGYTAATGRVTFAPSNSYGLGTTVGSVGGYFFQNSLKVLQHNATQNEWANTGNYIYYYSSANPSSLGTIQVSVIDKLVDLGSAPYISINNLKFSYANQFCIWGNGGSNKNISNNTFDRCNTGIFENNKSTSNSIIDNNTFTNIGSIAVYQYYATNLTFTNNSITNVGLEVGRMPYVGNFGSDSMWYTAVSVFPTGGLFEYNNIVNVGYSGFWLELPANQVLVQHNYVENPCLELVDCGAYYSYDSVDNTSSNINRITYQNNIAAFNNYSNTDWLNGFLGNSYGWQVEGFYKDGYLRATNWLNNFGFGFKNQFFSNPTKYSVWSGNISVSVPAMSGQLSAPEFSDISSASQYITDSQFTHNVFVNAYNNDSDLHLYSAQLATSTNNVFDYNQFLRPNNSWRGGMVLLYPSFSYLTFGQWQTQSVVGKHETTDNFFLSQTGIASSTDMVWYTYNPTKISVAVSFPAGYRYYTTSGISVPSDTLGAYQGKVYYRTINQGMPQASNIAISGTSTVGSVQTGSYTYSHEQGNMESGTTFAWYRSFDGTPEARIPISGATAQTYTASSTDQGQYIFFGVTPKSAAGAGSLVSGVEHLSSGVLIN